MPMISPVPPDFKKKGLFEWFESIRQSIINQNVLPSYTAAQIAGLSPTVVGYQVWNSTTGELYIWTGAGWRAI